MRNLRLSTDDSWNRAFLVITSLIAYSHNTLYLSFCVCFSPHENYTDPNQQQFYGQSPYPPPQPGFNQSPYNPAYPHQIPNPQPPAGMYGGGGYEDPEADKNFDFNDESIRRGFIRKVYSILCVSWHV